MTDRPVPSSRAADEEPGDSLLSAATPDSPRPSGESSQESAEASVARRRRWPEISP